ncbi:MAG: tetratricopeptide repeat protein [Saprospiraceae bacterium]|nr:tetratricopeptide repeat protein [Saprospiraceae bacterium]
MKRIKILAALLLFACTLQAQTLLDAAKKLIVNENYGEARKSLTGFISAEKEAARQAEAYYWLGETYYKDLIEENPQEALSKSRAEYDKGLALDKGSAFCLVGMGKLLLDAKNGKEAVKTFDQAIRSSKQKKFKEGHPDIYMLVGDAYYNCTQKNFEQAVSNYTRAREIDPKNGLYCLRLGDAQMKKGDAGASMSAYECAADKDKGNAEVYQKKARIWMRASKFDLASEEIEKGLKIDQNFAPLYKDKVEVLMSSGQYDKVTGVLEKYIPLAGKDFDARLRFCKFLAYQARDYDRSITEAKKLLTDAPDYKVANRWIAWSAFEKAMKIETDSIKAGKKSGPYGDAWKALLQQSNDASKALMLAVPADRLVYYDYQYSAKSSQKLGDMESALAMYQKVIENDSSSACGIYGELVQAYYEQKKYKEAFTLLDSKAAKGCKVTGGEYFYAMYYGYATKDYASGIKYADKYIEAVPGGSDGYNYKALCQRQSDTQEPATFNAKDTYEKLVQLHETKPDDRSKGYVVRAYVYLAYYYGSQNDLEKVKDYAQKALAIDPTNAQATQLIQN